MYFVYQCCRDKQSSTDFSSCWPSLHFDTIHSEEEFHVQSDLHFYRTLLSEGGRWRGVAKYAKQVLSCPWPLGKLLELVICMWKLESSAGVRFPQRLAGKYTFAFTRCFPPCWCCFVGSDRQTSPCSLLSPVIYCHTETRWNYTEVPWEFAGGFDKNCYSKSNWETPTRVTETYFLKRTLLLSVSICVLVIQLKPLTA